MHYMLYLITNLYFSIRVLLQSIFQHLDLFFKIFTFVGQLQVFILNRNKDPKRLSKSKNSFTIGKNNF